MPDSTRPKPGAASFLEADKRGWPRHAVDALIRRRMKAGLFAVRAQGIDRLRAEIDDEPSGVLFLANHSCWWDLFLVHFLNETIPVDGYGMMEHANLKRFGFFRRIGAYSVDRTSPSGIRASVDYTVGLLRRPRAGVWMFPQGEILGNDARPLSFRPGIGLIVRRARRVRLVPVAFRYEFWQDELPEAFVRFGEPRWVDSADAEALVDDWQARLTAELDALRADVVAQARDRFEVLLEGKRSISERYAAWRQGWQRRSGSG